MPATYDILIRNGTIIDGTGAPGVRGDVAIAGDRIAAVGALEGAEAGRVIDAGGLAVAPGFIDVHSHDDAACMTTPLDFKLMQGVTTDVLGNCGAGIAPLDPARSTVPLVGNVLGDLPEVSWRTFGEFMSALDRSALGTNVACLVPHGAVRHAAMGMDRREPAADELDAMREHIDDGMAAGAVGLSTGLIYPPGAFAQTDEIVECAKVAARHGGVYVSHIRNEAEQLIEAVREALAIGEGAELAVQISHHKAAAPQVWGRTEETIGMIEGARAGGADVTFDMYPYLAGSTVLAAARGVRREIVPEEIMVASVSGPHREYEGKTLAEIGELVGISDPAAIVARVLSDEPGAVAIFFSMRADDVRRVITHPLCMIGSDGIPTPGGKPHPRLYGTFPRIIQQYVREEGVLSLEEAVRKMTSLPADRFQLKDRGRLVEGAFADIVVFDPGTIADVATYEEPRQYPAGIAYVMVNGRVAAEHGTQTERTAGRLLRRGQP